MDVYCLKIVQGPFGSIPLLPLLELGSLYLQRAKQGFFRHFHVAYPACRLGVQCTQPQLGGGQKATCSAEEFNSNLVWRRTITTMMLLADISSSLCSQYIKRFMNETWLERSGAPLSEKTLLFLWSFAVSVYAIGGLLGCLCSGFLIVKYGKYVCPARARNPAASLENS